MPSRFAIAGLCALFTALSVPAEAQFVATYTNWQRLSPGERAGFVQGATDRLLVFVERDPQSQAFSEAFLGCIRRAKPNSTALEQGVTDAYRNHPELWGTAAVILLHYIFLRMCEQELAAEFQQVGLPPPVGADEFLANIKRNASR
ncbi:MAG: hypothetical protein ICV73_05500 [Acetobacteraceae bacterium]|nr:hypothetical protein [Acetobacteraceae bacterium]